MRVAHVLRKYNPAQWGGTETAVKQLLDGLKDQGVNGTVYAPALDQNVAADPIREAGHDVRRYRSFIPVLNLTDEQRAQLVAVGGNLMSIDLFGKLLAQRELSVMHTHALNRIGGIARTVAKIRKLPLVVTIHGGVLDLPQNVRDTLSAPLEGGFEWGKIFGALLRSREVLKQATQAANDTIERTKGWVAKRGRQQFTGERSIGTPDPGIVAIATMMNDLCTQFGVSQATPSKN